MKTRIECTGSNATTNASLTREEFVAVQDILMEQLDLQRDQITPGADIEADLGADSLDRVEIVMNIEERFGVTIADEQVEPVKTVEHFCEVLARLLGR